MTSDRRQFEREFSPRRSAVIEKNGATYSFQILDESGGGLGCYGGTEPPFVAGEIIPVMVEGSPLRNAVVRYVAPHARGGFHIGLQWQEIDATVILPIPAR